MIGPLILIVYLVGILVAWPFATAFLAASLDSVWPGHMETCDWVMATIGGLVLSAIWPLSLPAVRVIRIAKHLMDYQPAGGKKTRTRP